MKKLLVLMTALIMVLAMTACSIEPSDDGSDAKMINTSIVIDYPDVDDENLEKAEMQDIEAAMIVEEGTSAMDMLLSYADANNLEVIMDESSPTAYVTSIGGVAQTDDAGWVYEVDGEMTMDAADQLILEEGMKITWEFMSWGEF